ncbi:hypothetical protein G4B88_009559 [Cannabis sativa]|uniref:Uncharacterized protein n=1 Tax=Cannabis sativa TaxID=3483 RepID=A0A7J6EAP3_CANSA|nr:hypothetical protein G4B88_009559 [Cannabis sativa]
MKALKASQELLNTTEDDNETNKERNLNMKFQNYVPHDKKLQEAKVAPPVLSKFKDPVAAEPPPSEKKEKKRRRREEEEEGGDGGYWLG